MKFFLPELDNPDLAEQQYKIIKDFAEENLLWKITDRRIYSLKYRHEGTDHFAQVGEKEYRSNDIVIVIFETQNNVFLICTPHRGVIGGLPILVGHREVSEIVDFA